MNNSLIDFHGIYRADSNNISVQTIENIGLGKTVPQSTNIDYQGGIYFKIVRVSDLIGTGTQYQGVRLVLCTTTSIKEVDFVIGSLISFIQINHDTIRGKSTPIELGNFKEGIFTENTNLQELKSIETQKTGNKNKPTKIKDLSVFSGRIGNEMTRVTTSLLADMDRVHRYDIPRKIKKVL
ncbi:unnamed protein product, partial [marine sediment metagenome]